MPYVKQIKKEGNKEKVVAEYKGNRQIGIHKKGKEAITSTGKRDRSPVEKLTELLNANFEDDAFVPNFSYSGTQTATKFIK